MNWNKITSLSELGDINIESNNIKVLLFKHSTRCSISSAALNRIESNWKELDSQKIKPYYLDLLQHRDVSNQIAKMYQIEHQSPQLLLIENGKCIYSETHNGIRYDELFTLQ